MGRKGRENLQTDGTRENIPKINILVMALEGADLESQQLPVAPKHRCLGKLLTCRCQYQCSDCLGRFVAESTCYVSSAILCMLCRLISVN